MSIENALASVAVKDLGAAEAWYTKLLGRAGSKPMAEVIEWTFPNGGGLQVYALAERAGQGSFTLAVGNIAERNREAPCHGCGYQRSDVLAARENGDDRRPRWQSHRAGRSVRSRARQVRRQRPTVGRCSSL